MKFTFKKDKSETGLAAIGNHNPHTSIKVNGLVVGDIAPPNWRTESNQWKIRFTVATKPTESDPAPFRWITLTKRFDTEPEARAYITDGDKLERMLKRLKLFQFPKDE